MKNYLETDFDLNCSTVPEKAGSVKKCSLCERQVVKEVYVTGASNSVGDKDFADTVVKDHCYLTGKIRGLAHNECNLNTGKAVSSLVPRLLHNFCGQDCHLILEKLVNMAIETEAQMKKMIL